jgi:hypothetical protein
MERQAAIKETKRQQKALENRLSQVQEELKLLAPKQRVGKEVSPEEVAKQAETAEMIKRLRKDQKERQQKQARLLEITQAKLQAEADAETQRKHQLELEVQERRKQQLVEKHQKRLATLEERKLQRKLQDEELRQAMQGRPLHQKLEEKFKLEVLMPALEERKACLAKKRISMSPLSKAELKVHAKRYQDLSKESEDRRLRQLKNAEYERQMQQDISSRLAAVALEKQKEHTAVYGNAKTSRDNMRLKGMRYGQLVQELYTPKVVPKKQQSLESRSLSTKRSGKIADSPNFIRRRRVLKPTPSLPQKSISPRPMVDYLSELRTNRLKQTQVRLSFSFTEDLEDQSLSARERLKKVTAKLAANEHKVRLMECIPRGYDSADLQVEDELNEAVISGVKAKLALLDSSCQ